MTNLLLLQEWSALPIKVKFQTLRQEIIRRMERCDVFHSRVERAVTISKFMAKLKMSAYNQRRREKKTTRASSGNSLTEGVMRINNLRQVGRRLKKYFAKKNWFKTRQKEEAQGRAAPHMRRVSAPGARARAAGADTGRASRGGPGARHRVPGPPRRHRGSYVPDQHARVCPGEEAPAEDQSV